MLQALNDCMCRKRRQVSFLKGAEKPGGVLVQQLFAFGYGHGAVIENSHTGRLSMPSQFTLLLLGAYKNLCAQEGNE